MSTVLKFPAHLNEDLAGQRLGPIQIVNGLYGLWVARVICRDAFFVGAQVCRQMRRQDVQQVCLTGEAMQNSVISVHGSLYSGPLGASMTDYITALQDLHYRGGLLNDLIESGLDDPSNRRRHFTSSPAMTAGKHYSFKTPIYFRTVDMSAKDYVESLNSMIGATLGNMDALVLE